MIRNGLDTDELQGFVQLLEAQPEAGGAVVRTRHHWEGGYAVTANGGELTVAGETIPRFHAIASDIPEPFGGGDTGPAPGELLLAALAACVSSQFVEYATRRSVDIDDLAVSCEARLDLGGSYQTAAVRPGLQAIDLRAIVRSPAEESILDELLATAIRTSPVADTLTRSVPLEAGMQHRDAPAVTR